MGASFIAQDGTEQSESLDTEGPDLRLKSKQSFDGVFTTQRIHQSRGSSSHCALS